MSGHSTISRRDAIRLTAAALALPLAGVNAGRAFAADAPAIRVGIAQPTFSFIPLDLGIDKGFFKKYGVTIEKNVFDGSAKLHQAIAAGSIDIGLGSGPEFGFLIKGAPEMAIAAMADKPNDMTITVAKDGPIKTLNDLKGKKISCSTLGSLSAWGGQAVSMRQGWGPTGIEMIPLGSFGAQTAALETNQVAGMSVDEATANRLVEEGKGRILINIGDFVPHFHIHVTYASKDFIKNSPAQIKGFMAGWTDTVKYMKTHKADTDATAIKVLDLSPQIASKVYDALMPAYNVSGKFDPQALDVIASALVQTGTTPKLMDLKPYYTEQFLVKS
jgi:ABC-type nitrate/sulfonate/bicarbonate transport system substrate-binding protein